MMSNRIAKWSKPGQKCRYRDPTTTTWEKACPQLCVPLLPVCFAHLVQLNPVASEPPPPLPRNPSFPMTSPNSQSIADCKPSAIDPVSPVWTDIKPEEETVVEGDSVKPRIKSSILANTLSIDHVDCSASVSHSAEAAADHLPTDAPMCPNGVAISPTDAETARRSCPVRSMRNGRLPSDPGQPNSTTNATTSAAGAAAAGGGAFGTLQLAPQVVISLSLTHTLSLFCSVTD